MIAPLRRSPFASRSARPAITSSTDPALSDRGVNRGDAAPPSPEGRASPSRRSTRFGLRLAAHLLGERRDVGLSYAGVGRGAVFGGTISFDAVDRSALFVRPIDCRHEAALTQPSQRGACRVRKPARHNDQFGDARAAILPKQFDDLRQLRPPRGEDERWGAVPFSRTDEGSGAECSSDDECAGPTLSRKPPTSSTCPDSEGIESRTP